MGKGPHEKVNPPTPGLVTRELYVSKLRCVDAISGKKVPAGVKSSALILIDRGVRGIPRPAHAFKEVDEALADIGMEIDGKKEKKKKKTPEGLVWRRCFEMRQGTRSDVYG
jgi:hypothetical protein